MITAKQIRAARAILGWSQQDLADAIGLSKPTIVDAEKEGHQPRPETLNQIINVFQNQGLEFLSKGVRERDDITSILEGDDCYLRLMDEAHRILAPDKGEICFYACSEERSPNEVVSKDMSMRDDGIRPKFLLRSNDTFIRGPLEEYRWMPDKLWIDSDVKVIFKDRVNYVVTWQNKPKIICIRDARIAAIEKKVFNFVWDISAKVTHTTAYN